MTKAARSRLRLKPRPARRAAPHATTHSAQAVAHAPAKPAAHTTPHRRKRVVLFGDGTRVDVCHAMRQVEPLVREQAELVAVCTNRSLDLSKLQFDLLINFGGDGSILGAARSMRTNQVPVAGVNFGKIGYLATFEMPALLCALDGLLADPMPHDIVRRECLMLETRVDRRDGSSESHLALNDVVISRGNLSRIVELECRIDGELVTHYNVDGIVVASPVGSTAHSLAAGGPLLEPDMEAVILAPICPHTLAVRPLVVRASRTIEFRVIDAAAEAGATFDGQTFTALHEGDRLSVTAFSHRFVLLGGRDPGFYENLRTKLLWGGGLEPSRRRDAHFPGAGSAHGADENPDPPHLDAARGRAKAPKR